MEARVGMFFLRRVPTRERLTETAKKLGVSMDALYSGTGILDEPELQRRVLEASRARRESWLWLLAFLSALASVASAAAAWVAIGLRRG